MAHTDQSASDRAHITPLADPHQTARLCEVLQLLTHLIGIAETGQGGRAQWHGFRRFLGIFHDATGKAAHVPVSNAMFQKSGSKWLSCLWRVFHPHAGMGLGFYDPDAPDYNRSSINRSLRQGLLLAEAMDTKPMER